MSNLVLEVRRFSFAQRVGLAIGLLVAALFSVPGCGGMDPSGQNNVVTTPGLTSVVVLPSAITNVAVGAPSQTLVAMPIGNEAAHATTTFTSNARAVADVTPSGGVVTFLAPGSADITVTSSSPAATFSLASTVTATVHVTVIAAPNACSSLNMPSTLSVAQGATSTIIPIIVSGTGVTYTSTWTPPTTGIASVSNAGVVTGVAAGGPAPVTLSITCSGSGFTTNVLTAITNVTVTSLPSGLLSVSVSPSVITNLPTGTTQTLVVTPAGPAVGLPAANVTSAFVSNTPSVATVGQTSGVVTAVGTGSAVITVTTTSTATLGFSASTIITMVNVTVIVPVNACTSVALLPTAPSIGINGTVTINATIVLGGTGATFTRSWGITPPGIATVSQSGVVTGLLPGSATVTFTISCSGTGFVSNILSATASVTVLQAGGLPALNAWTLNRIGSPLPAAELERGWAASATTWFVGGRDNVANLGGALWRTTDAGVNWTRLPLTASATIVAVVGTSATNVYALGVDGAAWRFDGTSFTQIRAPGGFTDDALDIAVAGTSVFVLGSNNGTSRIERSVNGGAFTATSLTLPNGVEMLSLAGVSPTEAYAAGGNGLIYAWNGTTWSQVYANATIGTFNRILAPAPGVAFAGGTKFNGGTAAIAARLVGGVWSALTPPATTTIEDIAFGSTASELYAFDPPNKVFRFNGASWSQVSPATTPWQDARYIFSPAAGIVIALGGDYASVQSLQNSSWTAVSATPDLNATAAFSPTQLYVAGTSRTVHRFDGTNFSILATLVTNSNVMDMVAVGADDLLASNGQCVFRIFGGTDTPLACAPISVLDMGGGGTLPAFAVGAGGYIGRATTSALTSMTSGTTRDLRTVWVGSNTFALAGGEGVLLSYNGTTWQPFTAPATGNYSIRGLWGSSATDIYCHLFEVGNFERLFKWNGTVWTSISVQPALSNSSIMNKGASNGTDDSYVPTLGGVVRVNNNGTLQQIVQPSFAPPETFPSTIAVAPGGSAAIAAGPNLTFHYGTVGPIPASAFRLRSAPAFRLDAQALNAGGGTRALGDLPRTGAQRVKSHRKNPNAGTMR